MSIQPIIDNHGRPITYLRLSVTDRCNLRCFYCMPAEGIEYVARKELLSYEEMLRITGILASLGVNKVRITGGEPFVRSNLVDFLYRLKDTPGLEEIHLTTNGVLTEKYIPDLQAIGIKSVNLSLDTLDKARFLEMTRRDEFDKVRSCLDKLVASGIRTKINAVIMGGKNTDDIIPLAELARINDVAVRFIEEMPFNGSGKYAKEALWSYKDIIAKLETVYGKLESLDAGPNSTSQNYRIQDFVGSVGVIPAYSRTFCGSCNRIRLTAVGSLRTCLYAQGGKDFRSLLRDGSTDAQIAEEFRKAFNKRYANGYEAEASAKHSASRESMATIGG